jgi:hypothetical protein
MSIVVFLSTKRDVTKSVNLFLRLSHFLIGQKTNRMCGTLINNL